MSQFDIVNQWAEKLFAKHRLSILNNLPTVKGRADDLVKTVGLGPIQAKIKGERRLLTTGRVNKRVGVELFLRGILISCWHCKTGECSLQGMTIYRICKGKLCTGTIRHPCRIYFYVHHKFTF